MTPIKTHFKGSFFTTTVFAGFSRKRIWAVLAWVAMVQAGQVPLAFSEVRLPRLFSDNVVLQQNKPLTFWGWGSDGEQVRVSFRDKKATTVVADGKWQVTLGGFKAGGPDRLIIKGENTITLTNVLVGEVWVCSGQSNMGMQLRSSHQGLEDSAVSANPNLRLFKVPKLKADVPVDDVEASWVESRPETTPEFSAVAYHFGRALQGALKVPVGLIQTAWGGSPAEVWMRPQVLQSNPEYKKSILDHYDAALKEYEKKLAQFEKEQGDLKSQGKTSDKTPPEKPFWKPSELYNGMLAPLLPFALKGVIWYQGESNVPRAYQYRWLLADLIRNWRQDWRQGDFPFLAVQIAPWDKDQKRSIAEITAAPGDSDWAELREAQALVAQRLPKVGLVVTTDVGEKDNIHPPRKRPVGERLALAARGIAYGERKLVYSGPLYKAMKVKGNKVLLEFRHVGRGLEARGGELRGFSVAGADRKFVWAKAEIEGKRVVVSSPQVLQPVAVRYGWADYPVVNLWNKDGLPASPFRTDDFPMVTRSKN